MKNAFQTLLVLAALATPLVAQSPTLKVGDPAPALDVQHWIKGNAVTTFQPGQAYVVEFWATWCPPCKDSMPHLTKLQAELGEKIVIIGLSDEPLSVAKTFLDKPEWAEKTHYTLGTDPDRSVFKAYMEAADQKGIPTSFLVNGEGNIEWIGHPAGMDRPLYEMLGMEYEGGPGGVGVDLSALLDQEFESTAQAHEWFAKADAALRKNSTTWDFEMTTLVKMGMSMESMETMEMKRVGKVVNGGALGVRVDAKSIMDFPGMPSPMEEPSWIVLKDGVYYVDRTAPMPMMPSVHAKMTAKDAAAMKGEFGGMVSSPGAAAMFDKNPVFANPSDTLADILAMCSMDVVTKGENEVVVSGVGSPMLDLNSLGPNIGKESSVAVQLTLSKTTGYPISLVVGSLESPAFKLQFKPSTTLAEIDVTLFDMEKDGASWDDLAVIMREEMEQMKSMRESGGPSDLMDPVDPENEEF